MKIEISSKINSLKIKNMPLLCTKCSKDHLLKKFISKKGANIDYCKVCGQADTIALDCESKDLTQFFKSLIRYYYSEWEYNEHFGGDGLESLFFKENHILNWNQTFDEKMLEEAVMTMIEQAYEEYEKGVTLHAGYDANGNQNFLLKALKADFDSRLTRIDSKLKRLNYFLVEPEVLELLEKYVSDLESSIEENSKYFRARIGFSKKESPLSGWGEEKHYDPYKYKDIGAPPPMKANSGRMNRIGVSFLYLASDEQTAISEVRPHPGQIVSVGSFKNRQKIRIADFHSIDISFYYKNDKLLDDFLLLKSIENLFSQPISPDEKHKYYLTQFLADIMRKLEFEGIIFKSSLGSGGTNFTIFDPNKFEFIEGSEKVNRIKSLQYKFSKLKLMGSDKVYI